MHLTLQSPPYVNTFFISSLQHSFDFYQDHLLTLLSFTFPHLHSALSLLLAHLTLSGPHYNHPLSCTFYSVDTISHCLQHGQSRWLAENSGGFLQGASRLPGTELGEMEGGDLEGFGEAKGGPNLPLHVDKVSEESSETFAGTHHRPAEHKGCRFPLPSESLANLSYSQFPPRALHGREFWETWFQLGWADPVRSNHVSPWESRRGSKVFKRKPGGSLESKRVKGCSEKLWQTMNSSGNGSISVDGGACNRLGQQSECNQLIGD